MTRDSGDQQGIWGKRSMRSLLSCVQSIAPPVESLLLIIIRFYLYHPPASSESRNQKHNELAFVDSNSLPKQSRIRSTKKWRFAFQVITMLRAKLIEDSPTPSKKDPAFFENMGRLVGRLKGSSIFCYSTSIQLYSSSNLRPSTKSLSIHPKG